MHGRSNSFRTGPDLIDSFCVASWCQKLHARLFVSTIVRVRFAEKVKVRLRVFEEGR